MPGQLLFMTTTAFVVARTTSDPSVALVADTLAGSALIIGTPMVLLVTVHWRPPAQVEQPTVSEAYPGPGRSGP